MLSKWDLARLFHAKMCGQAEQYAVAAGLAGVNGLAEDVDLASYIERMARGTSVLGDPTMLHGWVLKATRLQQTGKFADPEAFAREKI